MEDVKIIDLYFARSEDAVQQTDAAYGKKLFSLADRILHDAQDSEESVSDTYMKTWQTIPPQRPVYFYAYLAKLCIWETGMFLRKFHGPFFPFFKYFVYWCHNCRGCIVLWAEDLK